MKKIVKFLRRFSIQKRLFGFILLPLALIIVCFLLYYSFSKQVLFDKNEQASIQRITMAENSLSLNALHLKDSFAELCAQGITQDTSSDVERWMEQLGASTIIVYDQNHNYQTSFGKELSIDSDVYTESEDNWFYDAGTGMIGLIQSLYENGEVKGYAYALFSQEVFAPILNNATNHTMLMMTNAKNEVLFGYGPLQYGATLRIEQGKVELGVSTYFVQQAYIAHTNWKVLDLVNEEYIYEEMNNMRTMLLLYGVVCLIILLFFSSLFYHSIYDPIHKILVSMHAFNDEDMESILVQDSGHDEIHDLNETFNALVLQIETLLTTVKQEQEQRRETQFQLLQAQINPHFLFNTLNTLRYLAILNEDKPVSEGIAALSKLLRDTIVEKNELVTIQEEIENIKSYVIIQKLRYGDIFETVYNIDEDVKYHKILKFLLQPIVENSILHAFEEDREHQILTIHVSKQDTCLKIEIGDNGKGFVPMEEKINKKLSGIGMQNIQDRISLMYGDDYKMEVKSVVNVGTITTLYLPLQ